MKPLHLFPFLKATLEGPPLPSYKNDQRGPCDPVFAWEQVSSIFPVHTGLK